MAWTEKRVTKLKKLWAKGLTASQVAAELGEGATRNAVIGKAHRLGLSSRPSPVKGPPPKAEKKPVKKAEKAAPKNPEVIEIPKVVTILSLTDRMCKWPIGHPGEDNFHFCGQRATSGQPYCAHHCSLAYQAPQPRRDRRRTTGPGR